MRKTGEGSGVGSTAGQTASGVTWSKPGFGETLGRMGECWRSQRGCPQRTSRWRHRENPFLVLGTVWAKFRGKRKELGIFRKPRLWWDSDSIFFFFWLQKFSNRENNEKTSTVATPIHPGSTTVDTLLCQSILQSCFKVGYNCQNISLLNRSPIITPKN